MLFEHGTVSFVLIIRKVRLILVRVYIYQTVFSVETNYSYYEQLVSEKVATNVHSRSISAYDSVSLPTGTPTALTQYKVKHISP